MSLINDVLRNLETNRPDVLAGQNLQREIRSLPPAEPPRLGRRLALLATLLLVTALAAWQWLARQQAPSLLPPVMPVAEVPTIAPAPPGGDGSAPLSENLKLAQELLSVPAVEGPLSPEQNLSPVGAAAATDGARAAADVGKPEMPPAVAATAVATPVPVPRPPEPARIEKSPSLATPRDRADSDWRRGEAALAGGRAEEGREALRAALRHDPAHVQARQALLRQLLEGRRIDEAILVLQEGLNLLPAQTGWAMSLARLHLEQGELAAADGVLARSQAFAESNADYAGFQGLLKTRLGQHRQAAAHYQRAAALAPNDGRWWLGLGLALESDGRLPEGREALRRALASGNLPADLAAVAEQHLR